MAISKIASAGVATTDSITASQLAPDSVGHSELNDATGITTTHHKIPSFADADARDAAISSPANGMIIYNTNVGALQQYNGVWSTIAPAPNITALSGFLNDDTDSTITVFGTNFTSASSVKMFTAASGGTQIGSNATTTFNTNSKLTAVFGAGSIGASGSTAYIEVDNSGATNRFATAITVNADPTVTHAGATGTSANTTNHLGTYTGEIGAVDTYTKLLLNFDRGGGKDLEDSSNLNKGSGPYRIGGHKVVANNDAIIKASPFGDGKSAIYMGDNDYLTIPSHADFAFGAISGTSNDFTVEAWHFFERFSDDNGLWRFGSSNELALRFSGSDLQTKGDGNSITMSPITGLNASASDIRHNWELNRWYHIAFVRSGTRLNIYANGIKIGTSTTAIDVSAQAIEINRFTNEAIQYVDEIRVCKGVAVYTGNFTVPTARFSPTGQSAGAAGSNISAVTAAQTKLLIHSNLSTSLGSGSTTFTDSSDSSHSPAGTNVYHSTLYNVAESTVLTPALAWPASGKEFASYGAYFDGTGDYLSIADHGEFDFTGTWTIDFWVRAESIANYDGIISFDLSSSTDVTIGFGTDSKIHLFSNAGGGTSVVDSSDTISVNTWYHVAISRDGTTTRFFLGGVLKDSDTSWNGTWSTASGGVEIGRFYAGTDEKYFNGYIDVVRISNGIARWTANFTPPTKLYIGVAGAAVIPTITLTGAATQLAADEDIEFTAVENSGKADGSRSLIDTDVGLTLTNLTGADKSKATLTGSMTSSAGTTHENMPMKAQVRKTLGDAAYNNSTTVTFSGSTTTAGLAPAMPVSGTGIPTGATISTVDSATVITLSAATTGGSLTAQSLVFEDLTRITHVNGSDTLNNADAMYTIATGTASGAVLFNARRYMGTGTFRLIDNFGFAPDMIWIKARGDGYAGVQFDTVRGAGRKLQVTDATAQSSFSNTSLYSFTNDGFLAGSDGVVNANNITYIAWGWKAGGAPTEENSQTSGAMTANSVSLNGTLQSSYTPSGSPTIYPKRMSINTAGGFSIVEYVGQNAARTIPHGLSDVPEMIIVKKIDQADGWKVWSEFLSTSYDRCLSLDTNAAESGSSGGFWNNSNPGAQVFSVSNNGATGYTDRYIALCFHSVAGVSKFGEYDGSSSATTTISGLGFTPRFVMVKTTNGVGSWHMYDTFRGTLDGTLPESPYIRADVANAEATTDGWHLEVGSGYFKWNDWNRGEVNKAGESYIYIAFA